MLSTIGDWYRIVQTIPNDDRLRQRRSSAARLAASWADAQPGTLLDAVSLILDLVSDGSSDEDREPTLGAVLASLVEDQPSLDPVTAGNLDARICTSVAVGEVLARGRESQNVRRRNRSDVVLAGALASSLRNRDLTHAGQLGRLVAGLLETAETTLDALDERRRDRRDGALRRFERATASDDVDLVKAVKAVVSGLHEEMLKDREELQALWWVFGEFSYTAGRPFAALSPGDAAVLAGRELSETVEPPASRGIAALAGRMLGATQPDAPSDVRGLLEGIGSERWAALRPATAGADLIRRHPAIFPITRLAMRVKEIGTAPALEGAQAFAALRRTIGVGGLAEQVYAERALFRSVQGMAG